MLKLQTQDRPPLQAFTFSLSPPPNADLDNGALPDGGVHPRPPADFLPERDMHMYGAYPLVGAANEPGRGVVRCVRCDRTVLEWAAGEHRRICSHVLDGAPLIIKKAAKAGEKRVDVGSKKHRLSELSDSPPASPLKKQRPRPTAAATAAAAALADALGSDDELDLSAYKGIKKSELKKLLKERERVRKREAKEREKLAIAERKRQRATNPLDYDRQCGVINDKNLPCSRSLTCKTHTVGAKRAVQGRTRPYDELFIEWQRAHNPNFKEPAPKRDKEARRAEKASGNAGANGAGVAGAGPGATGDRAGATAADRKATAAAKRRRLARGGGDEEGLRYDEDGQREMDELIRATRICGDRVRSAIGLLGAVKDIQRQSFIGTGVASANPPGITPPLSKSPSGSQPPPPPRPNAPQRAVVPGTNGAKTIPVSATIANSVSGDPRAMPSFISAPQVTFSSIWRTTSYDQANMGDLLTKALAARARPGTVPTRIAALPSGIGMPPHPPAGVAA